MEARVRPEEVGGCGGAPDGERGEAAAAPVGAARPGADPFGRFLKVRDVAASVGRSRAMIYRLMHEGRDPFPSPIKIGAASVWVEQEVVAWKARRVETRNFQ